MPGSGGRRAIFWRCFLSIVLEPRPKPVEELLEMPGHLLRRCHQIAVAVFLDECQAFDLTPPQYVSLAALATHGPLDKATLGGVAALDRTTVAVVIKNLQDRAFVSTRASEEDRRATLNEITAQGLTILKAVQDHAERAQERMLAPLTRGSATSSCGSWEKWRARTTS